MTPQFWDVIDLAAKAAVGLGAIKLFLVGIYKPFAEWRKEHVAKTTREVLKPELAQLRQIIDDESGCAGRMDDVLMHMREIFTDLDKFLDVAADTRDRQDETNDLLDAIGFHAERRVDEAKQDKMRQTMADLNERRKKRRRALVVLTESLEKEGDE
jgi:hypothetical protein